MADRGRVRFAADDDHAPPQRYEPSFPEKSYASEIYEASRDPRSPQTGHSVRFHDGPPVNSPQISSPVVRDPTPFHRAYVESGDEDEVDESPRTVEPLQLRRQQIPLDTQMVMHSNEEITHREIQPVPTITQEQALRRAHHRRYISQVSGDDVFDEPSSGEDTVYDDSGVPTKKDDASTSTFESVAPLPSAHARPNERSYAKPTLRPSLKRTQTTLEEGGVPASRGIVENLISLYGLSKRQPDHDPMTISRGPSADDPGRTGLRSRGMRSDETLPPDVAEPRPLDPDHPLVTGIKKNTRTRPTWQMNRTRSRDSRHIVKHIATRTQREMFILRLAKALMTFGAPSHRIESQLDATAIVLEVNAQFIHLPSVIIASFGDQDNQASETHFVKANGRLALGKLHNVHQVYRQVVHDEISAEEGTVLLTKLMREPPLYNSLIRCFIAFLCCALICPLAFGGSFLDMWVAGACGAVLCFLQLHAATKSAMYANVFELSVSVLISFVARGLSTIPGRYFCYEAISSSGVVLILPGYLILCSALELASKNIVNGSVRMIYAIIYSLFLGFGLTIGSDLYYIIDRRAQTQRFEEATANRTTVTLHGAFTPDNSTVPSFDGVFTFSNDTDKIDANTVLGCYRDPTWPWFQQDFPFWSLFLLVPTFSLFSSLWNLQPLKSKQLPVMILISCAAFAANQAANKYILNRSDVVSAIGAFVVGILGNLYSRVFRGTAFQCMVIGVLFLVPSGIAAAGGLSQNYRNQEGDEYTTGLAIGLRMIQVAIGITVGLFGSGLIVYSFGTRKQAALFAF